MPAWGDLGDRAYVSPTGNLSLGKQQSDSPIGGDDGAGDATHPWAKDDTETFIPAALLISTTLPALTVTSNVYMRTLAAATTHNVQIPISGGIHRTYTARPHGFKINSFSFFYRVNTGDLTSITPALYTLALASGTFPTVTSVTGTASGGTLTAGANMRVSTFTVTTPAFQTTSGVMEYGEEVVVVAGGNTCDAIGAFVYGSWGMY